MLRSIEGVFRNGRVELQEAPAVEDAQVIVTFLVREPFVTSPGVPSEDPQTALQKLAELRRDLPTVDAVQLVLEGREDLAARSQI